MAKLIGSAILLALCATRLFAAEGAWIALAPAGDPRQEVGAAELNGKIYIVGGLPSTNRVQEYDPATNTWRIVASLPIAVDHPGATSLGGKLYVMGGNTANGSTNALFEYDPATDQWTPRPSMPTARNALGSVAISGKIYAVGGAGTGVTGRELEVYDPGNRHVDAAAADADGPESPGRWNHWRQTVCRRRQAGKSCCARSLRSRNQHLDAQGPDADGPLGTCRRRCPGQVLYFRRRRKSQQPDRHIPGGGGL